MNLMVAAGLQEEPQPSPPCIKLAYDCLMSGCDPEFMLGTTNAKLSTLWSYFCRAVQFAVPSELVMVWTELVPHDLVRVLHDLRREANAVLGGPLTELMPVVLQRIDEDSEFHDSELQFELLRFARTCILATTDVESEEE